MSSDQSQRPGVIEPLWCSYAASVLPADAPAFQVMETRRAFYAGAGAGLVGVASLLREDGVTEEMGFSAVEAMFAEVRRFKEAVQRGDA